MLHFAFIHLFHSASYRWDKSLYWMTLIFLLAKGLWFLFKIHISFLGQLKKMISWFLMVKWPWNNAPLFLCLKDTLERTDLVHYLNSLGRLQELGSFNRIRIYQFQSTVNEALSLCGFYDIAHCWKRMICVFLWLDLCVYCFWFSH